MTQEQNNGSEGLAGEYLSCVCIKLKVQLDLCSPDMGLSEQQFALLHNGGKLSYPLGLSLIYMKACCKWLNVIHMLIIMTEAGHIIHMLIIRTEAGLGAHSFFLVIGDFPPLQPIFSITIWVL